MSSDSSRGSRNRSQFALREAYARAGKIKHYFVFFRDDGQPIRCLNYFYKRWRYSVEKLKVRYREPYAARHCSVSWNLMIGKNLMCCAQNHAQVPPKGVQTDGVA